MDHAHISTSWAKWRDLEKRLLENPGMLVVMDGGMGTEVERIAGPEAINSAGWTSSMNLTHPDAVWEAHKLFLQSGAELLITNTYGTNRHILAAAGLAHRTVENNLVAVQLAQQACKDQQASALVVGSISIHAPGNEEAKLAGEVPWPSAEEEFSNYQEQARLLMQGGCDMLFVELVWNMEHGQRVMDALKAMPETVPIFLGLSFFNEELCLELTDVRKGTGFDVIGGGHATTFGQSSKPLSQVMGLLTSNPNVVGVNVMHTKASLIPRALALIRQAGWTGFLGCYPDHGLNPATTRMDQIEQVPDDSLVMLAEECQGKAINCRFYGGCCGFGPRHIERLSEWARSSRAHGKSLTPQSKF